MNENNIPQPIPAETQANYVARVFKSMPGDDAEEKSRNALSAWRNAGREDKMLAIVNRKFPAERFIHTLSRPIFVEHATVEEGTGKKIRYKRKDLQKIVDKLNSRIFDKGEFSGLSEGHTPTVEQYSSGAKSPPLLGFCGAFRLGIIGNINPKWAIFADEYVDRDNYETYKNLPRRSAEVWIHPRMEDRFIDPVACLGSEAPRLEMGTRYAMTSAGVPVMKYSAAMPGATNTFVPKLKYGGNMPLEPVEQQPQEGQQDDQLVNSIVEQVIDQLMGSKYGLAMQIMLDQLEEGDEDEDETLDDESLEDDDNEETLDDDSQQQLDLGEDDDSDDDEPEYDDDDDENNGTDEAATDDELGDMDDDERTHYAALSLRDKRMYMKGRRVAASKVKQANPDLAGKARYMMLSAMSRDFTFDPKEEFDLVSSYDDNQFDKHLNIIKTRYSKRNNSSQIPVLETPDLDPSTINSPETRSNQSKKAKEMVERYSRKGKNVTFDECLEAVRQGKTELN